MSSLFDKKYQRGGEKVRKVRDPLIADIKREMFLRGWENGDLAKAIGYETSTVNAFFANIPNRNRSKAVEVAICKVLNITY